MVIIDYKKYAFTLAESLICILILGIISAMMLPIFTKKHNKPIYNASHGIFACYNNAGKVYSIAGNSANKKNGDEQSDNYCTFTPQKNTTYLITGVGPGGLSNNSSLNGTKGAFETYTYTPTKIRSLYLLPAQQNATATANSTKLCIDSTCSTENSILYEYAAGSTRGTSDNNNVPYDLIDSCVVLRDYTNILNSFLNYSETSCTFDSTQFHYGYRMLLWITKDVNYSAIGSPQVLAPDRIMYKFSEDNLLQFFGVDTNHAVIFNLKSNYADDLKDSSTETDSDLVDYIVASGYVKNYNDDGTNIADDTRLIYNGSDILQAGKGSAAGNTNVGIGGAIVILW